MKLFYEYMVIFFNLSPTSSHLYPLQAVNYDSNSRLVVNEDDNKFRLERVNQRGIRLYHKCYNTWVPNSRCYRGCPIANKKWLVGDKGCVVCDAVCSVTTVPSQKAVSAYFTSKQILPFGFAEYNRPTTIRVYYVHMARFVVHMPAHHGCN